MPILLLDFQSYCNESCASDADSSGCQITPWYCLSIVASIPLLQQTITEPTDGAVDSFSCTMIKLLCSVDVFFFFQGFWERKHGREGESPLKSPLRWTQSWYVQIYSIYTSPGQRPVSLVICHPTQISSPIPGGVKRARDLLNISSQRTHSYSHCLGLRKEVIAWKLSDTARHSALKDGNTRGRAQTAEAQY